MPKGQGTLERLVIAGSKGLGRVMLTGAIAIGTMCPNTVYARASQCQPGTTLEYKDNSATVRFDGHRITVAKDAQGKVTYQVDDARFAPLRFNDMKDFKEQIGRRLDHELGRRRRHVGGCIEKIYSGLRLGPSSAETRPASGIERTITPSILDAKEGAYTLDPTSPNLPLTYLLVRNANTRGYYCLSLAQEVFDVVYGLGEAKRVGLYSDRFAEGLNFADAPASIERYASSKHDGLPKGGVIRLSKGGGPLSSIGISLGDGKMAHLIGDTVYIEKIRPVLNEGWEPTEVITPDDSFKERNAKPVVYRKRFAKGSTLEQISPQIDSGLRLGENLAAIEEILFQLNRDKFKVGSLGRRGYTALLAKTTTLRVPEYWMR